MTGKPILVEEFDGTTRDSLTLVVEIAWGADITAADTTWTWTDVTADVYIDPGVSITIGRGDEASKPQPAQAKFTLDNTSGDYGASPLGANWPNVKRGTPIRVRVVLGTTSYTRFQGYAVGFSPSFDVTGTVAVSKVTAAGVLRRLGQGATNLQSVMRSSIPTLAALSAYWPMEDAAKATSFVSALTGGLPLQIESGTPELAANGDFDSSDKVPELKGAYLLGRIQPSLKAATVVKLSFLVEFPELADAAVDDAVIARIHTTGSIIRWDLLYNRIGDGGLELIGANFGGQQFTNGGTAFAVDGTIGRINIVLTQDGDDVTTRVSYQQLGDQLAGFTDKTATSQSLTGCYAIAFSPDGSQTNLSVGHVYVQTTSDVGIFDLTEQLDAFTGEQADDRFERLCDQIGVTSTVVGDPVTSMGPQDVDTAPNLLQECADVNRGIIVDGLSAGLTLIGRDVQENEAAALTVDATSDAIMAPFDPVDDDQQLRNKWTVTQKGGSSAVSQDLDGPLGINTVGLYDDSRTMNLQSNLFVQGIADWLVHETTVQGYRYPSFTLEFAAAPDMLADWLAASLLSRIDVTNIAQVMSQLPDEDIRMLIQGWTETIGQFLWTATTNTSPYDPWRLVELADATDASSDGEFLCAVDTSGSTVATAAAKGATSLSVATTTAGSALWTTDAGDFPLWLDVAGIRVKATACTGTSSPQTFTVDATTVTKALSVGDAVSVWQPPVLGF